MKVNVLVLLSTVALFALMFIQSSPAQAGTDAEIEELIDLDSEELGNISVSVASIRI